MSPTALRTALLLSAALLGCRRGPRACADNVPPTAPFRATSDADFERDLAQARSCALATGRRVLLEFGASWCPDCRRMAQLDLAPGPQRALSDGFARVRVGLEDWHGAANGLRTRWHVDRIASYVVLDPRTGEERARRTLEPVTGGTSIDERGWSDWLRAAAR